MARRQKRFTITDGTPETNRDHGKTFILSELPADQAERWAIRCLLAFANAGVKIPEAQLMSGLEGLNDVTTSLMVQGVRSLAYLQYTDAKPLLDEMLTCIRFAPDNAPMPLSPEMTLTQVEEVKTLMTLRYEVLVLHLGFSPAAVLSPLTPSPTSPSASPSAA